MANIKKIYDDAERTTQVYPQTHERAVVDNNGTTAETKFQMITDLVNQKQMEIGAVPSDLAPTAGSTNWVTSGGVKAALRADNISYDNSQSGLDAESVQEAVDEVNDNINDYATKQGTETPIALTKHDDSYWEYNSNGPTIVSGQNFVRADYIDVTAYKVMKLQFYRASNFSAACFFTDSEGYKIGGNLVNTSGQYLDYIVPEGATRLYLCHYTNTGQTAFNAIGTTRLTAIQYTEIVEDELKDQFKIWENDESQNVNDKYISTSGTSATGSGWQIALGTTLQDKRGAIIHFYAEHKIAHNMLNYALYTGTSLTTYISGSGYQILSADDAGWKTVKVDDLLEAYPNAQYIRFTMNQTRAYQPYFSCPVDYLYSALQNTTDVKEYKLIGNGNNIVRQDVTLQGSRIYRFSLDKVAWGKTSISDAINVIFGLFDRNYFARVTRDFKPEKEYYYLSPQNGGTVSLVARIDVGESLVVRVDDVTESFNKEIYNVHFVDKTTYMESMMVKVGVGDLIKYNLNASANSTPIKMYSRAERNETYLVDSISSESAGIIDGSYMPKEDVYVVMTSVVASSFTPSFVVYNYGEKEIGSMVYPNQFTLDPANQLTILSTQDEDATIYDNLRATSSFILRYKSVYVMIYAGLGTFWKNRCAMLMAYSTDGFNWHRGIPEVISHRPLTDYDNSINGYELTSTTYVATQMSFVRIFNVSNYKGKRVFIESGANGCSIAFMNGYNTPTASGSSIGTFATGYSAVVSQSSNTTETYTIPSNCNYILLNQSLTSSDEYPMSVVVEDLPYPDVPCAIHIPQRGKTIVGEFTSEQFDEYSVVMVNDAEYPYRIFAKIRNAATNNISGEKHYLFKSKDIVHYEVIKCVEQHAHDTRSSIISYGEYLKVYVRMWDYTQPNDMKRMIGEMWLDIWGNVIQPPSGLFGRGWYNPGATPIGPERELFLPTRFIADPDNVMTGDGVLEAYINDHNVLRWAPCYNIDSVRIETDNEGWTWVYQILGIGTEQFVLYSQTNQKHGSSQTTDDMREEIRMCPLDWVTYDSYNAAGG